MESSIPTSLEKDIISTKLAIKSLINDIKNYDGPAEELKRLNEFGRVKLSFLRELIHSLDTYISEQADSDTKTYLNDIIKSEKEQFQSVLKDFQKANVQSMLSVEKKNLEELFAMSNPEEVLKRRNTRQQSSLLQQNAEATEHMSSISRQLADVVSQSSVALETLVKSSTNITGIRDELKSTGSFIDQSAKLLNKYEQREFSDKILISAAFIFFLICVAYVIYSRIGL